jgi:galactose mutarotase-like enzyme
MPRILGGDYTPDQLRALTGTLSQLAGVRSVVLAEGKARGLRVAEVWTGSGLRFQVLLDRALDIGAAEHRGRPLAWVHVALGTPAQYDPRGRGWLRTFGGGLLTTCGLSHFGPPEEDGHAAWGLHGRIAHAPAERVRVTEEWRDGEFVLEVVGEARETAPLGENLLLTRTVTTRLGADHLTIEDRVRNDGFRPASHMMLYHCNFGFPVVSPESELIVSDASVTPRDDAAAGSLARHRRFEPPDPGRAEEVFFHRPRVGADGLAQAAIVNRALGFGAYLRYRAAELPCLAQWKMMGAGDYVCALEPATHPETTRRRLREEGGLRLLSPGEEVRYRVEVGALGDIDAVRAFEEGAGRLG